MKNKPSRATWFVPATHTHTGNVYRDRISDVHRLLDILDAEIVAKGSGVVVDLGKSDDIPTVMQNRQHLLQPMLESADETRAGLYQRSFRSR